jgi:dipeptidase D
MSSLSSAYYQLEPQSVWRHFGALNSIPRPSGQEEAARLHIQSLAEENGALWKIDARGNLCVRVPPRGEVPNPVAPIVVLQSHLDMVCQKRPDVTHDFETDAIAPRRDGDKIYASGTTLGADNGMGAAMMMAILTDDELIHPPLELLFTVEEETGLYGAANLDAEIVRGRLLINLDSEDPDEITVGCAGGASTNLFLPIEREPKPDSVFREIKISGLQGGHSGIQIGEPLGSSLKILSGILDELTLVCPDLRLVSLDGGTAHNAIPRDAIAVVALPAAQFTDFEASLNHQIAALRAFWGHNEPGLMVSSHSAPDSGAPLSSTHHQITLGLLRDLPHGVQQMSARFAGKVQTSSNLAEIHSKTAQIGFCISNRSFVAEELAGMQKKVAELGRIAGATIEVRDGYPGWEPRGDSFLLQKTAKAFEKATGRAAKIEVVHAGLECGLLSEKLPDLDAVSFGPLIRGAHTPEEWVSISSVEEIYGVLTTLLRDLA